MDILKNNLDNIIKVKNLFGEEEDLLAMKDRIGFIPISIWEPDWQITAKLKEVIGDSGQSREFAKHSLSYRSVGWSGKGSIPKISIFNPHLAQMILSAYCPKEAKIYDPFAGRGTRAFIASAMGHKYYGIDLNNTEVERIIAKRAELNKQFHVRVGDSQVCWQDFDLNSFDFSYTCPPYYNLEIYSADKNDLSNAPDYNTFLSMLSNSMDGTYKLLKNNSLSVWVVGNLRDKKGNLIGFNGDIVQIAKKVGFDFHDEIIFWGASKCASQRAGIFSANRRSVRVHEHILIFRKP